MDDPVTLTYLTSGWDVLFRNNIPYLFLPKECGHYKPEIDPHVISFRKQFAGKKMATCTIMGREGQLLPISLIREALFNQLPVGLVSDLRKSSTKT